jgi:hypothetical protein
MTGPSRPAARIVRAELVEMHMNELDKTNETPGFFESVAKDEGVQRSVAGVAVAIVVAVAKHALFGSSS